MARVAKSKNLKRDYPPCLASPGVLRLDRRSASLAQNLFGRLEIFIGIIYLLYINTALKVSKVLLIIAA